MWPLPSGPNYITGRRSRDRNAAAQTRKYIASFGNGLNPNGQYTDSAPKKVDEEPISQRLSGFMGGFPQRGRLWG